MVFIERGPGKPVDFITSSDPEALRPLASFGGNPPPAPPWFGWAIGQAPDRQVIRVKDADIEMLAWGARGAPGLLLVCGANAHADWWSFIAPYFCSIMRVVALSPSGMGRSDWRERYSTGCWAEELLAIADAGGLFESVARPIVVGHSFGGVSVLHALCMAGDRFGGGVLVDTPIPGPAGQILPTRSSPNRVMANMADAITRYRVAPPQVVSNPFVLDHFARHSIKAVEDGVQWCFDPFIFSKLHEPIDRSLITRVGTPMALIRGETSAIVPAATFSTAQALYGRAMPQITIPGAGHHVMLDQPLAFVAALRGLFSVWPSSP